MISVRILDVFVSAYYLYNISLFMHDKKPTEV